MNRLVRDFPHAYTEFQVSPAAGETMGVDLMNRACWALDARLSVDRMAAIPFEERPVTYDVAGNRVNELRRLQTKAYYRREDLTDMVQKRLYVAVNPLGLDDFENPAYKGKLLDVDLGQRQMKIDDKLVRFADFETMPDYVGVNALVRVLVLSRGTLGGR